MLKAEFNKALSMVNDVEYGHLDGDVFVFGPWWERFEGCGLPEFPYPVLTDLREVAQWLRYQCMQMNGQLDQTAVEECWQIAKRKFKIDTDAAWNLIDSLQAEVDRLEDALATLGAEKAALLKQLRQLGS